MLVLSRKRNQEIVVNGNIRIHVIDIKGNSVRLGIEAPKEVAILRGELIEADQVVKLEPHVDSTVVNSPELELTVA